LESPEIKMLKFRFPGLESLGKRHSHVGPGKPRKSPGILK